MVLCCEKWSFDSMLLVSVNRCEMTSLLQNYLLWSIYARPHGYVAFVKNPSRLEPSRKHPIDPEIRIQILQRGDSGFIRPLHFYLKKKMPQTQIRVLARLFQQRYAIARNTLFQVATTKWQETQGGKKGLNGAPNRSQSRWILQLGAWWKSCRLALDFRQWDYLFDEQSAAI